MYKWWNKMAKAQPRERKNMLENCICQGKCDSCYNRRRTQFVLVKVRFAFVIVHSTWNMNKSLQKEKLTTTIRIKAKADEKKNRRKPRNF